ncbi:hypothetical protein KY316_00435 [Candidatus Woesearchaeota archaeon]|nr:hypothetical protein [Candidatus Woesearchaeota archaeon]
MMKFSIDTLIRDYVEAKNNNASRETQYELAKRTIDNAFHFEELRDVYISIRKSIHNFYLVEPLQQRFLFQAKTFEQQKEVYLWARQYDDTKLSEQVKEKIFVTAGIFELEDFYYFAKDTGESLAGRVVKAMSKRLVSYVAKIFKQVPFLAKNG